MSSINEIQALNGLNPLAYLGVNPYRPPQSFAYTRDPNSGDSKGYYLLAIWLNTTTNSVWVLVSLAAGVATWIKLSSGSSNIEFLQGNTGGPVGPNGSSIINVIGDGTTISVAGNPGTNTLTISAVGTGVTETLTGNSGGAVSPLAGNINVVGDATTINVTGNPGTHTLTISAIGSGLVDTLTSNSGGAVGPSAGNINVVGDGTSIVGIGNPGTHTITFTSGPDVATVYSADAGTASPILGIIQILADGAINNCGSSVSTSASSNVVLLNVTDVFLNTLIGSSAGNLTGTGIHNTGLGDGVLTAFTTANSNVAIGHQVMHVATTAAGTTAVGESSLNILTTGNGNTALGQHVLQGITTGASNTCIGIGAGSAYVTGSESYNILLGSAISGVNGESNICRIGSATGSGANQIAKNFIAGIRGVTTDAADAVAVLISSTGQLGTVSSSIRYKENVNDMGSVSEDIYDLRPVTFNYKNRACTRQEVGLIAEEVAEVYPELVIYNDCGLPETVRYHELPIMMLNEMHKLLQRIEDLEQRLEDLEVE